MSDTNKPSPLHGLRSRPAAALAAVGLLALGGGAGAVAMQATRPSVAMAPATPTAIRALSSGSGIVTIKGRVAEVYGNKFIMADASGRALVDTGREGEGGLVTPGEPVTVQGRFDRGFLHAAFLVGPGNEVVALGPIGGPHDGPGRHGPRHGPEDGAGAPPPPAGADRDGSGPPPPPPTAAPTPAVAPATR